MTPILKRAGRNLIRIPGRTALVGLLMTVVAAMVTVGLAIEAGAKGGIRSVRQSLGSQVTLQPNIEALRAAMGQGTAARPPVVTESMVKPLLDSPYISAYDFGQSGLFTSGLKPVEPSASGDAAPSGGRAVMIGGPGGSSESMPTFRGAGNANPAMISDFATNAKMLVEGRFYTADEVRSGAAVAVIDRELAALNGVKLGDRTKMTLRNGAVLDLEVIGLYETRAVNTNVPPGLALFVPNNTIYLPYTTIQRANAQSASANQVADAISSVTFVLDDPLHLDAFREEAKAKGLDTERFTLDAQDQTFKAMVGPLQSLADVARTGTLSILIAGGLILVLALTVTTRERRLEVGILRALGTTKRQIAAQFAIETIIICLIALLVGGALGSLGANVAANSLLHREVAAVKTEQTQGPGRVLITPGQEFTLNQTAAKPVDRVAANLSLQGIGLLLLTGIGLAACGSLVSIYFITKVEPAAILAGRN